MKKAKSQEQRREQRTISSFVEMTDEQLKGVYGGAGGPLDGITGALGKQDDNGDNSASPLKLAGNLPLVGGLLGK